MPILFSQSVSFTIVGGGQEIKSKKIIDDISVCATSTCGICMLGAPTVLAQVKYIV